MASQQNSLTEYPIKSGDIITLTTADPITHPHPDVRILELQWVMNCVAAMADAATDSDLLNIPDEP